jgi:TRAP-type C4-dicarboxylate transport system permease small subunit
MCVRKNNHIQVDFFYHLLPRPLMRVMATLVDIVRIAFLGACVVLTWQLLLRIGSSRMAVVELPMGIVYGAVLAGFALMTWRAVGVALANWRRGASVLERPELADEAR